MNPDRVVRVGTCGFCGDPAACFDAFDVVEVQDTSSKPPSLATAQAWRADAPDGFEFTLRAPRRIIADRFRDTPTARRAWKETLEIARALRATMIVLACPASFRPDDRSLASLARFCEWAHRDRVRLAFEPRGAAWTTDRLWPVCRENALTHAVDPLRRTCVRPRPPYFRLPGPHGHRSRYAPADIATLAAMCVSGPETWCVFGNIAMAEDARRLRMSIMSDDSVAKGERRVLRFDGLGGILADAERMDAGRVRTTGQWTAARIVMHVAVGIERSVDGYGDLRAPEHVRASAAKRRETVLEEGLPSGIRIPDDMSEIVPPGNVAWGDALGCLRRAVERAGREPMHADHPFLGPMTADQWRRFHCRHAELHFGFVLIG